MRVRAGVLAKYKVAELEIAGKIGGPKLDEMVETGQKLSIVVRRVLFNRPEQRARGVDRVGLSDNELVFGRKFVGLSGFRIRREVTD